MLKYRQLFQNLVSNEKTDLLRKNKKKRALQLILAAMPCYNVKSKGAWWIKPMLFYKIIQSFTFQHAILAMQINKLRTTFILSGIVGKQPFFRFFKSSHFYPNHLPSSFSDCWNVLIFLPSRFFFSIHYDEYLHRPFLLNRSNGSRTFLCLHQPESPLPVYGRYSIPGWTCPAFLP